MLKQVLLSGGIAVAEADEPLEQVVLVLDIIKFHTGECKFLTFLGNIKLFTLQISFGRRVPSESNHGNFAPRHPATTQASQTGILFLG